MTHPTKPPTRPAVRKTGVGRDVGRLYSLRTCPCPAVPVDEVVGMIREHLRTDHAELIQTVTAEMIRGWVEVVA